MNSNGSKNWMAMTEPISWRNSEVTSTTVQATSTPNGSSEQLDRWPSNYGISVYSSYIMQLSGLTFRWNYIYSFIEHLSVHNIHDQNVGGAYRAPLVYWWFPPQQCHTWQHETLQGMGPLQHCGKTVDCYSMIHVKRGTITLWYSTQPL